ncbi:MAG: amino acid ABC transporter substrate-binding protein [Deltaproteobacteria bacterium HGW-Deltaproteobacteria-4]|nr:MAG: amino acid ABC transporter substrate-binding protein [Deltaproteobacteria bacterium HGW-Deltaproteobacteria-4]
MTRIGIFLLVWFFISFGPRAQAEDQGMTTKLSNAEIMRLGEQMYRYGLLPSGEPMEAFIRGDIPVDSTAFSCSSCHLRAGLGSYEGGVVTPPTTGRRLYQPYRRPPSFDDVIDQAGRYVYAKTIPHRGAYSKESLAIALWNGIDPGGQEFNPVMPRYLLSERDMDILIRYLEELSANDSPGVTGSSFSFATIITDDVSAEDRQALLVPLERFVAARNQQVRMYDDFIKFGYTPTNDMKYAFRPASLTVWELKGPPETWPDQLQAYYDKGPVFAILGGISNSDWRPIHEFCEAQRLPCLYPITNYPVVSETDWYTVYFNKGFYQEGEGAALYLKNSEDFSEDDKILQLVQDSLAGKALSAGFDNTWSNLQRPAAKTLLLSKEQLLDQKFLAALLKKNKADVLLLWGDGDLVPALPAIVSKLAAGAQIFVSSTFLGKETSLIAESIRSRVFITFPFRLTPFVGSKESFDAKVPTLTTAKDFGDRRITSRTETMLQQSALQGLKLLYDNLFRDYLLDVMSMQMDQIVFDYERLSFGPGQRYTSKGCYILQLGAGADPQLIPRSEWVMH